MDTKQLLLELSAQIGVAGRETQAVEYAETLLRPYGDVSVTPLGSLLCTARPPVEGGPHLLLDAHIDEIGMMVTSVAEGGFLRVGACGGMDRRLLAAAPVTIFTGAGPLTGVICSTPPHLSGDEKPKNKKVDELYIDTGLAEEEAREAILPGDVVTLQSHPKALLGGLVSGKAIDDRAGCAVHLKALEFLGDAPLNCGLTVLFSSMEEVGCQGAKTAAYIANPTHCIAVDVSFAYTPDSDREKTGDLKKGPMIGFAPILNAEMSRELVTVAKEEGIPFQYEVMSGRTGTNADSVVTTRGGVTAALVSVPQKYMHSPIETVAVEDVDNAGRLIAAYIKRKWGTNQ